jgi:hypothetical protein
MWREIVGVVGNVKHLKLSEPAFPDVYVPILQKPVDLFSVVVRTRLEPAAFASALRRATGAVDPNEPVNEIQTMLDLIARSMDLQITLLGNATTPKCDALFGSPANARYRHPIGAGGRAGPHSGVGTRTSVADRGDRPAGRGSQPDRYAPDRRPTVQREAHGLDVFRSCAAAAGDGRCCGCLSAGAPRHANRKRRSAAH